MFRISFHVIDDDLVRTIKLVTPFAVNLSVTNAPVTNGAATPLPSLSSFVKTRTRGMQSLDNLLKTLNQRQLKTFRVSMFREIIKETGLNPVSSQHYLQELIRYGCLSKHGRPHNRTYQVTEKFLPEK